MNHATIFLLCVIVIMGSFGNAQIAKFRNDDASETISVIITALFLVIAAGVVANFFFGQ